MAVCEVTSYFHAFWRLFSRFHTQQQLAVRDYTCWYVLTHSLHSWQAYPITLVLHPRTVITYPYVFLHTSASLLSCKLAQTWYFVTDAPDWWVYYYYYYHCRSPCYPNYKLHMYVNVISGGCFHCCCYSRRCFSSWCPLCSGAVVNSLVSRLFYRLTDCYVSGKIWCHLMVRDFPLPFRSYIIHSSNIPACVCMRRLLSLMTKVTDAGAVFLVFYSFYEN